MERKLTLGRTVSIGQQGGKVQQVSEQSFYVIECRLNHFCLRSQPKSWRRGDPLRVTGTPLERDHMAQLWMFKRLSKTDYEIIHVKTDLVLTVEDFEARLCPGEQAPSQRFELIAAAKGGSVRIKDCTGAIMRLEGVLEAVEFSEREESQLFRLNPSGMFEVPQLRDTIFILTHDKEHSLDLANASREGERDVIVYRRNLRMNQRWRLTVVEEGKGRYGVHILSALSGQFVVQNRQSGGLMQASYPQLWLIEETEIKEFIFILHGKRCEYLAYSETAGLHFAATKKSKWYIRNGMEGLYLKRSLNRTVSI